MENVISKKTSLTETIAYNKLIWQKILFTKNIFNRNSYIWENYLMKTTIYRKDTDKNYYL